MLPTDGFW